MAIDEAAGAADEMSVGMGMGRHESAAAHGWFRLVVTHADGTEEVREGKNTIPANGLALIADRISDAASAAPTHMGVGTGTPSATALGSEIADRHALTSGSNTGAVATFVGTWAATHATGAWTEAGIFNADAAGTMLCSSSFAVINKGAGDAATLTWTVTISTS